MEQTRTESDFLGSLEIPDKALYGIHSKRAFQNFPNETIFHIEWYQAIGLVKRASYESYKRFKAELLKEYGERADLMVKIISDHYLEALIAASSEVMSADHFNHFIVPALSGGAGTSLNLNVCEIIANRALELVEKPKGSYTLIDPLDDANIFQSTNDVVPTALKIALIGLLKTLEESVNKLRLSVEAKEHEFRETPRVSATELMQAVPTTFGRLFSTYQEALSRDWWRISKCFERLKVVNMGGGAIGTGLSIPRFFIFDVTEQLRLLTGFPLSRGENLQDTTCNLDSFVEVMATLKSHAVNLEKMAADLRLLSSDLLNPPQISIPKRQVGSSIMPGKVNPVICEYLISVAHKVYSNDQLVSSLAGQGQLDLNAYIPLIGHVMIESVKLLTSGCQTAAANLIDGITIPNPKVLEERVNKTPSVATALVPYIGHERASSVALLMREESIDIFSACKKLNLLNEEKLKTILTPSNLQKLGFSMSEIF